MHQDPDVIARFHPERLQAAGAAQRGRGEFLLGVLGVGEDQRQGVRVAVGGRQQQVAHGRYRNSERREIFAAGDRFLSGAAGGAGALGASGMPSGSGAPGGSGTPGGSGAPSGTGGLF